VPGVILAGGMRAAPLSTAGDTAYRRQLDGLRALAVGGVLVSHLTPFGAGAGGLGVALFFVLSGYLITGILFRCKELVLAGQPLRATLRQFYVRRFLRILPIVYLVLGIGLLVGDADIRRLIWWHLAYLSNFFFAAHGFQSETAHFWSLAVEEQFYVVWPLVILVCARRAIVGVAVGLILLSAAFRVVAAPWFGGAFPELLTPCVMDALCFGALLTIAAGNPLVAAIIARAGPVAAAVVALAFFGLLPRGRAAGLSAIVFCRGIALAWFVGLASRGDIRVLGASALVYIGRISYGIYVYHPFVKAYYDQFAAAHYYAAGQWPLRFAVVTLFSVAVAAISWHFFELPINALKRYFPYSVLPEPNLSPVSVSGLTTRRSPANRGNRPVA
jgi:peptidoglycan/LPS O-acetylase OafA/YrhL